MQPDEPELWMGKTIRLGPGVALRQIGGWWHIRFYDSQKYPKEPSQRLNTPLEHIAIKLGTEIYQKYLYGAFDPWRERVVGIAIRDAVKMYLRYQESEGRKPSYIKACKQRLGKLSEEVGEMSLLETITPTDIRRFIFKPHHRQSNKYARFQTVQAFFNWSVRTGLLKASPTAEVRKVRLPAAVPDFLSVTQFQALVRSIEVDYEAKRHMLRTPREIIWLRDVVIIAVYTGLRPGELLRLQWNDVHLSHAGCYIRVAEYADASPKWDSFGSQPVPKEAMPAIERLMADRLGTDGTELVFKSPKWRPHTTLRVSRCFKKYARMIRLPDHLTLYSLRDTYASWLVQAGVDIYRVQKLMRHKSVETTMRYAHLIPDDLSLKVQAAFDGTGPDLLTEDLPKSLPESAASCRKEAQGKDADTSGFALKRNN